MGDRSRLLPAAIVNRLPVRYDYNADYFSDPWQGIPINGYGDVFKKILSHPKITVLLNTDFLKLRASVSPKAKIFYSGPIDRFFEYKCGLLGWRTIQLEEQVLNIKDFQGTSVVNYPDAKIKFTRIHEFKHYHPERGYSKLEQTVITREFSRDVRMNESPSYPMNRPEDEKRLLEYKQLARPLTNLTFGGRLGDYRYYNMDQTIRCALNVFAELQTKEKNART